MRVRHALQHADANMLPFGLPSASLRSRARAPWPMGMHRAGGDRRSTNRPAAAAAPDPIGEPIILYYYVYVQ